MCRLLHKHEAMLCDKKTIERVFKRLDPAEAELLRLLKCKCSKSLRKQITAQIERKQCMWLAQLSVADGQKILRTSGWFWCSVCSLPNVCIVG